MNILASLRWHDNYCMLAVCISAKHPQEESKSKEQYTYRLVESERVDGKVKQRTLLNLGRHFAVPKSEWKALAGRISQIIYSQQSLLDIELSVEQECMA